MTGPLRIPIEALSAGDRELDDSTARYATRVHRLKPGDAFVAFDPLAASEADASILTGAPRVRVRLDEPRPARHVPIRRVTVIQTASKGSRVEDVLRDATELGATRFVVAIGQRSVRRPDDGQRARWLRVAIEAARQCGRGDIPSIEGPIPLELALEESGDVRWLLDPRGAPLHTFAPPSGASVVLVIGPEGGFDDAEFDRAARLGYARVSLGAFVLRTETACSAALGAIAALGQSGARDAT